MEIRTRRSLTDKPSRALTRLAGVPSVRSEQRIACFATQGPGSGDERRIRELLELLEPEVWHFERSSRARAAVALLRRALRDRPEAIVMEGTGIAGGAAVMLARAWGVPYLVSSGDAVGPFLAAHSRWAGQIGGLYERALCRLSAGYVGWTPYLAGRALTLGAPRAMTAAGWAPEPAGPGEGAACRQRLGIPDGALVFGIVGALNWNPNRGYCYGLELVRAAARVQRAGVHVLVVGDGTGLARLREEAERAAIPVHLPGAVEPGAVPAHLAAMDVGSLPQSVDGVGAFRYSTKLPEYLAAGLPVVTGQIPAAYDLGEGWLWRLEGEAPWDERYVAALAALMSDVEREEIAARRARVPRALPEFDREAQQRRAAAFVRESVYARRQDHASIARS
jgi:hypothetical protein